MSRGGVNGLKWGAAIAITSFLAGAAAVAVPHGMGAEQIILAVITAGGIALAAALAMRLAMEQRANREIEEARRRLVAAASHDLRTPLASLRLLVEAIDDGVVTGLTRDRYLREIRTHVGVLGNLVDDLFELSRIEAGDIAWTMRQIELGELIDEMVAAMQAPAGRIRRPNRIRAPRRRAARSRQRREGAARPLQPAPERHPTHPRRRERHRARSAERQCDRGGGRR